MQLIYPAMIIAIWGATFWFVYVYVTQDHSSGWKEMLLWMIVASIPKLIIAEMIEDVEFTRIAEFGVNFLLAMTFYVPMYFILKLRYGLANIKKATSIFVVHYISNLIFLFPFLYTD